MVKAAVGAAAGASALGSILVIYGFTQSPHTQWIPFMIVFIGLVLIGIGMATLVAIVDGRTLGRHHAMVMVKQIDV